jgi:hypothetical protein
MVVDRSPGRSLVAEVVVLLLRESHGIARTI